jgi:hypothetical protein
MLGFTGCGDLRLLADQGLGAPGSPGVFTIYFFFTGYTTSYFSIYKRDMIIPYVSY